MFYLLKILHNIEYIIEIIIIIRVLISWFAPHTKNSFTDTVYALSEPLLSPFRNLINIRGVNIDFSPIIVILIMRFFLSIVTRILYSIYF